MTVIFFGSYNIHILHKGYTIISMSKSIIKGKKFHISNSFSSANAFWMSSYCVAQNTMTEAFLVTCKLFSYKELAHVEIV